MRMKFVFLFLMALVLCCGILAIAAYVGIVFACILGALFLASGYIFFKKLNRKSDRVVACKKSEIENVMNDIGKIIEKETKDFDRFVLSELDIFNLNFERTKDLRAKQSALKLSKKIAEINLRYADTAEERNKCKISIKELGAQLKLIEADMKIIAKQCEIEVKGRYTKS